MRAGIPVEKPAYGINQACLSGMQAILAAARAIRVGEAEVVLAGGMESMSRVPFALDTRWGARMGNIEAVDLMSRDGFLDPLSGKIMGETAETLAQQYGISREEQDAYAAAIAEPLRSGPPGGPVSRRDRPRAKSRAGKKTATIDADEHPRDGVTAASLASSSAGVREAAAPSPPATRAGSPTAPRRCSVMSADAAKRLGVTPTARIVGWRVDGVPRRSWGSARFRRSAICSPRRVSPSTRSTSSS